MKCAVLDIVVVVSVMLSGVMAFFGEGRGFERGIDNVVGHAPIRIDGDSDFTSGNGVTGGNGTEGNPYVIANYTIDGRGGSYGIYIGNTSKYFVIRGCRVFNVTGSGGEYTGGGGIVLYNV
ncbi:MAG: right-handed parallel beta-helix repeat-containing protein, partial [Thermoplasmata archaeon]|nr:right-handed parallel beta-helix repeat-containing protein [Thermoplasmata archaeon]